MKFKTIRHGDLWFIMKPSYHDWEYYSGKVQFGDGYWWFKSRDRRYGFDTEQEAGDFIERVLMPYYMPETEEGSIYTQRTVTETQSTMFDLMNQMFEYEKKGDLGKAREINDKLIQLHSSAPNYKEAKSNWITKILSR